MFNQPQKLKFKKCFKTKRKHYSLERSSNMPKFGGLALQAINYGQFSAVQIEAIRRILRRGVKKLGNIKINTFPSSVLTKKPVSARMGKGKGKVHKYITHVLKGKVVFELFQVSMKKRRSSFFAFSKAIKKLPFRAKVIFLKY
jgi:large subunit ribosomal protein L16